MRIRRLPPPGTAKSNTGRPLRWPWPAMSKTRSSCCRTGREFPRRHHSPIQLLARDPRDCGHHALEPLKAVELLESATSHELGSAQSALVWYFGSRYPEFVPGDAYLAAHRADDAAREYEKILSHRDLMIGEPLVPIHSGEGGVREAAIGKSSQTQTAWVPSVAAFRFGSVRRLLAGLHGLNAWLRSRLPLGVETNENWRAAPEKPGPA